MQRRGRGKKRPQTRENARGRIKTLYSLSFEMARKGDLDLARRYLELARKIGMRNTVRIPSELKIATCRNCMIPLLPGITARFRQRGGKTVITCLECGKMKRLSRVKEDAIEE
jgi:ribonuclease P protein subunit RPR2